MGALRIVVAPDGSRGDVQPMLVLAERLARDGHELLVCASPGFSAAAAARRLAFRAYPYDCETALAEIGADIVAGGSRAFRSLTRVFAEMVASQLTLLAEAARGADVLVSAGTQIVAETIAEQMAARHVHVAYAPTLVPSAHHPPITLASRRLPRPVNRLLWKLVSRYYDYALLPRLNLHRAQHGLARISDVYAHHIGPHLVAAFEPELAAVPDDARMRVTHVGYLHGGATGELPDHVVSFLNAGPEPIYVGFGSMTDAAPETTTSLILDAARRADVRLVIGAGWAKLGRGAASESVLVVDDVPHEPLFARCAAVVHHGGSGTTATAARAGTPQMVIPHVVDQQFWGKRVHALGLGPPPIPRKQLAASRLGDALRAVVADRGVRDRSRAVATSIRARNAVDAACAAIVNVACE